ncbi:MAG: FimV/HubP family polar landmark protein [Pseudomonadota bacterium]
MARVCKLLLGTVLTALSGTAAALGLGDITLNSGLNQRLDAQIEIVAALPGDLNELEATLASRELFAQYGIDYPQFLTTLTFQATRTANGEDVLQVRSDQPITEPFVTFLVEANWPRGRLLREYTVLLDPPTFLPGEADAGVAPAVSGGSAGTSSSGGIIGGPTNSSRSTASSTPPPVAPPGRVSRGTSTGSRSSSNGIQTGAEYGPVRRGESLWKIAARARPSGASLNQTMMAIYRQNPDAFLGNMNLLRQGSTLRIPTADAIRGVSTGEAAATLVADTARWRGEPSSSSAASAPTASTRTAAAAPATAPAATAPELQLVAPEGGDSAALARDLDAAREQNEALQKTVQEQRAQLEQAQERLRIRDAELAALESRLREAGAGDAALAATPDASDEGQRTTPGATLDTDTGLVDADTQVTDAVDVATSGEEAEATLADLVDEAANDEMAGDAVAVEGGEESTEDGEAAAAPAADTTVAETPAPSRDAVTTVTTPPASSGGPLDFIFGLLGNTFLWLAVGLVALLGAGAIVLRNRANTSDETLDELGAFPEDDADLDATLATTMGTTASTPLPGVEGDRSFTTTIDTELPEDDQELARTALVDPAADDTSKVSISQPMEVGEFSDTGQFEAVGTTTSASTPIHEPTQLIDIGDGGEDGNDPMSEADFHMAYGLFDQAADLINKALEAEPDRKDLQAKLLEIYFVWGNKDAFREAAERLKPSLSDAEGGWEKFAIMGRQICPDDDLFVTEGGDGAGAVADLDVGLQTASTPQDLSLDTSSTGGDDDVLDIGLDELPEVPELGVDEELHALVGDGTGGAAGASDDGALDIDLDLPPPLPDEDEEDTEVKLEDIGVPEVTLDDGTLDADGDLEPDEELTEIARKLEERMAPASGGADNLDLSLDLGQTIAPEAPPETSVRLDMNEEEDDGFGDFFAFTGVVDESELPKEEEPPPEEHVLDASGDLLGLASTGEFKIELPEEDHSPFEVTEELPQGDVTGKNLTLRDGDAEGDTEQQPAFELPGGLSLGDETQEGFMLQPADDDPDAAENTALISAATMIGTDGPAGGESTVETPMVAGSDPSESSVAPTIQMPIAPEVSSTAETVSAQVLDLRAHVGDGDGDETTRVPASQIAFPEADDNALDEVGTKLDLARAYIDMGDAESARSILEEVVQEGSTEQRDDANTLLSSLG